MKSEKEETSNDEATESISEKSKEESSGEERTSDHAIIPEEFQRSVASLIEEYKDSKPCLGYIRERVYSAEEDLRKREQEANSKNTKGKKVPSSYSLSEAPSM